MTDTVISTDTITTATIFLKTGDTVLVTPGGSLTRNVAGYAWLGPDIANYTAANNNSLTNFGSIVSRDIVWFDVGGGNRLYNSGQIIGYGASSATNNTIQFENRSTTGNVIINDGLIRNVNLRAIELNGPGATSITNTGVIVSPGAAIEASSSPLTLDNSGLINGGITLGSGGALTLANTGRIDGPISGPGASSITNSGTMGAVTLLSSNGFTNITNTGAMGAITTFAFTTLFNGGTIAGDLSTGAGGDTIDSTHGVVTGRIVAGLGADTVLGGADADRIYGDDLGSIDTNGGADRLFGGGGDDTLNGGYGSDVLYGNQGEDVIYGNQDNDWIHGGQGDDLIYAGQGDDIVYGGVGNDVLYGNRQNDEMYGGDGSDILYGGQDTDTLDGGAGDDLLSGNLGNDTFIFAGPGFGHDTVRDFGNGADVIRFGPGTFSSFADVQAHSVQLAGGVLLTDAVGDTVYLIGANVGALTAGQFTFG